MHLDSIKSALQQSIGHAEYDQVFTSLNELVSSDLTNSLRNDLVILEARYNDAKRAGNLNFIDLKELSQRFSHVAQALLWLISRLNVESLNPAFLNRHKQHNKIPHFHAFTCDRIAQKTVFDEHYFFQPGPLEKFRFFYLYGDARQEMESLFTRFAYDRNGLINNRWRQNQEATPSREPLFRFCKPEFSDSPRMFEMYILRDLFASFFDPVNEQQINPDSRLSRLLDSPEIKALGPTGHVFVLFTMDDYNWDAQVTPLVVKRLFEGFYNCALPPESPHFYFFFGLEYSKSNQHVKAEVTDAINKAEYGVPLPELKPVSERDMARWFSEHRELCDNGLEPDQMTSHLFTDSTEMDMADIELILKPLIAQYNLK